MQMSSDSDELRAPRGPRATASGATSTGTAAAIAAVARASAAPALPKKLGRPCKVRQCVCPYVFQERVWVLMGGWVHTDVCGQGRGCGSGCGCVCECECGCWWVSGRVGWVGWCGRLGCAGTGRGMRGWVGTWVSVSVEYLSVSASLVYNLLSAHMSSSVPSRRAHVGQLVVGHRRVSEG